MSVEITMPKWGLTMKEGILTKWYKSEGDAVEKGDALFEVETEKITNSVEAPGSGTLFQIVVGPGSTVPVGTLLGIIAEAGETPEKVEAGAVASAPSSEAKSADKPKKEKKAAAKKAFVPSSPAARRLAKELGVDISQVPGTGPNGRVGEADVQKFHEEGPQIKATPLAAQIASDAGLDLSLVTGTGENGKITKSDVEKALAGPGEAEEGEESLPRTIPYSGMRQAVGENMMASLQNAAQLTAFVEVDVTEMVDFLAQVREEYKKDASVKVSYNDILIYIIARALKRHPIMNSTMVDEQITLHADVHMGMAVALQDGLIVPVLQNADKKGLLQIAKEARVLAKKARTNTLEVDEVTGGTFTISNTSMLKVDGFTPILKPPETGIMGIGRVKERLALVDGEVVNRSYMTLSLTYDHRVVDGAPAHAFLQTVANYLEKPVLAMC